MIKCGNAAFWGLYVKKILLADSFVILKFCNLSARWQNNSRDGLVMMQGEILGDGLIWEF